MDSKIFNSVCPRDCFGSCGLKIKIENGKAIEIKGDNRPPVNDDDYLLLFQ